MRERLYILSIVVVLVLCNSVLADRGILADAYLDKLDGMWLGQMLGNYAGRQVEGYETVPYEGPNPVNKSITEYQVQWGTILTGQYYTKTGASSATQPSGLVMMIRAWSFYTHIRCRTKLR